MDPVRFVDEIKRSAGPVDQAVVDLEDLRRQLKRDHPSGRYISLAITALEEAGNWLQNARNYSAGYRDYE